MYKHLLVPVDGRELSDRAMRESIALAKALGARLTGFVCEPPLPMPTIGQHASEYSRQTDEQLKQGEAHARQVLASFADRAKTEGLSFEGHFVRSDKIDQAIADAAAECGCDLIVMATHGRGTLGELLFGSHTKGVMGICKLPMLVLQ